MSLPDYDVVDTATGEVVMTVRHLWGVHEANCCICDELTTSAMAVPYYCGPVREGCNEGGYATACVPCFKKWEAWNDKPQKTDPQAVFKPPATSASA